MQRRASARRLAPGQRAALSVAGVMGHEWLPAEPEWQRAEIAGRIKKPKLEKDRALLMDLFAACERANVRETVALVWHQPYLLALTDDAGFTALHHAVNSRNVAFVRKVLDLYHQPRSFVRKYVRYESEADLREDGLRMRREASGPLPLGSPQGSELSLAAAVSREQDMAADFDVVVQWVAPQGKAGQAGVVPGDLLDNVELAPGAPRNRVRRRSLTLDETIDITTGIDLGDWGFPTTLQFTGSALGEILGRDGWTPVHSAAGGGAACAQILVLLLSEQESLRSPAAHDAHGYPTEFWTEMSYKGGKKNRPLSAGRVGHSSRPQTAQGQGSKYNTWSGGAAVPQPPAAARKARPQSAPLVRGHRGIGERLQAPRVAAPCQLLPPAPECTAEIPDF